VAVNEGVSLKAEVNANGFTEGDKSEKEKGSVSVKMEDPRKSFDSVSSTVFENGEVRVKVFEDSNPTLPAISGDSSYD
jgi:hypothetical protein